MSLPTHDQLHTLDVFRTRSEQTVESLLVDPPQVSDHSQIVGALVYVSVTPLYDEFDAAGETWTSTV